ncbi:protein draper-like isoform X2 [Mercenaria mercenaria]|uniref:protein draper-like isoform X2 n=1 Tax=Mercenaria mercenaria TaxID=6596 RepID=UPI00234F62E3|nr:protein draper-like isoform X2 [Mercenaria mercenaria]
MTTECIDGCLEEEKLYCYNCLRDLRKNRLLYLTCTGCHEYVSHTTGECKSCPDGCVSCFNDRFCYDCINGLYGNNCNKKCGHCEAELYGDVHCNKVYGTCNGCADGYYGHLCDNVCGHCLPYDLSVVKCHQYTGECGKGCADGYFGRRCDKKCGNCLPDDKGAVTCDTDTGNCPNVCIAGYFGKTCDQKCHSNCFDPNINTSVCNIAGKCIYGCVSEWYGDTCNKTCSSTCSAISCSQKSGFCEAGCIPGWYGDTCNISCSSTCHNKSCDQYSGHCDNGCASSYYGDTCEFSCVDTCKELVCDRETSQCLRGCVTGYGGAFCNMTMNIGPDFALVGLTSSLAGVIILLVLALIIWFIRRVLLKGKRYGNLRTSTRVTFASIYDELSDRNNKTEDRRVSERHSYMEIVDAHPRSIHESGSNAYKTEEHRVSGSHSYMEIVAAHQRSIHESGPNTRNCCDDDFAANYASSLATVENIKDTPLVFANALNMSALHSDDNKDNKSDSDETQISSFISSDDAEVNRKGSNRSRKYYEIPDIVPGVNHNVKIESNLTNDGYEIPISSASTNDRKGKAPKAGEANLSRQCNRMTDLATSQTIDSKRTQNKQLMSIRNKEIDVNDIKQTPQKAKDDKCNTNHSGFNMEMQFETHQPQEEVLDGDSNSLNYIHPVN